MEAPTTAVESYTGVQTNVRFKPGINFQYMLNAKGSTPAEILGTSYKTVLKPALNALADEAKRISVSKLDESIDLEKQLQGNVKILEEKRSHISVVQAKTDEASKWKHFLKLSLTYSTSGSMEVLYHELVSTKSAPSKDMSVTELKKRVRLDAGSSN